METMNFGEILILVIFSGMSVFSICWAIVRVLKHFGADFSNPNVIDKKAEKVTVRLEYFSEYDGWHVKFNRGFGTCYGILTNLNKGQAEKDIQVEAAIIDAPNGSCGFYQLAVM